jgi:enterochelin esterase family protein
VRPIAVGCVLGVALLARSAASQLIVEPEPRQSFRLQKVVAGQELAAGFWQERQGKGPLVEELPDDSANLLVTFLWRGDAATRRVEVRGGPVESSRTGFERIPHTDIWHLSLKLPRDARLLYNFVVQSAVSEGGRERMVETYPVDPLNPNEFDGGSVLELPGASADVWHLSRRDAPRGKTTEHELDSKFLGERRRLSVYRPTFGAQAVRPQCLAIFFDGEEAGNQLAAPAVLDNLIAAGSIPPTMAVMVHSQGTRGRDLLFSKDFARFVASEVIPWIEQEAGADFETERTILIGQSLGGLTAVYLTAERPEVFGAALSQSGAFWRTHPDRRNEAEGWLPGRLANPTKLPARFYLEVGRFEPSGMVETNRRLRDVLRTKGCKVAYTEANAGHDYLHWRESLGRGLIELLGAESHNSTTSKD